jgi:hypothetical protein
MFGLIKSAWIRLLIAFDVRDPLKRTGKRYVLPEDFAQLDPQTKARATVCNLFANHKQRIDQVARLYEMSRADVISILLAEGLIEEKRRNPNATIKGGRRETDQ